LTQAGYLVPAIRAAQTNPCSITASGVVWLIGPRSSAAGGQYFRARFIVPSLMAQKVANDLDLPEFSDVFVKNAKKPAP
jgi:hypothetical protein